MLTPHYKHQLHRTLKNKACKTHLTVEDSHTIELFKGSGHVIGMLSILTGHPRYVKLAATGPVTAAFVDAEHFLAIFVDDEEQIALAARETGVMDSTAVGAGSGGMGDVDVAYANPMARRGGAMSDAHANTTGRVSITERVVPTLTGATANAGGSAQPREVRNPDWSLGVADTSGRLFRAADATKGYATRYFVGGQHCDETSRGRRSEVQIHCCATRAHLPAHILSVSRILCTVTFHANHAHSLTRSP
jgi:hypothetical protein